MKALLIVDVQNDFLPGGALAIPEGDKIIDQINEIQPHFPLIVATKDCHPPNHISFASTHQKKPGESIAVKEGKQELWPDHCIQGTFGSEFSSKLEIGRIKKIFFKGIDPTIDSYSAFFDNVHSRSTGLGEYLKEQGVDSIYIAGLATDYCVKYSVLDALHLGFQAHVILDCCCGINLHPNDIEKALETMKKAGATFILSTQL